MHTKSSHSYDHLEGDGSNSSEETSFKGIARDCFNNSTIRGLGRIPKETHICIKSIWIVAIIVFISIALVHVVKVCADYRSSPVVTVQQEFIYFQDTQESENHVKQNFPTVTVCNANPMSPFTVPGLDSYKKYLEKVNIPLHVWRQPYKSCMKCLVKKHVRESLQSLYGYFSYLGLEDAQKVGHNYSDLVISCELLVRKYYVNVPCGQYVSIKQIQSPNFFNCYLIQLDSKPSNLQRLGLPRGFTLTIYTGEIEYPFPINNPHGRNYFELDSGILLALQAPGKYPDLSSNSYHLEPGLHHHIAFSTQCRKRLKKPFAGPDCKEGTDVAPTSLWDLRRNKFAYSHDGQIMSCVNKALMKNCSCLDPDFPIVQNKSWLTEVPFCAKLIKDDPGGIDSTINRLKCMHRVEHEELPKCAGDSKMECTETMISSDLSGYAWPRASEQLSFYKKRIKNQSFEHHFNATYDEIETLLNQNQFLKAREKLLSTTLIKENFLKVTVEERSEVSYLVEDKPKWSRATFLGSLGGTLNLWAGISFLCVFELIVLCAKLMCYCHKKRSICSPAVQSHCFVERSKHSYGKNKCSYYSV